MLKVAFQGELGSNSHELCRDAFAGYAPCPQPTFAAAFEAVRAGDCAIGVIAIENSAVGRVADVHALLPNSGLVITGEHFKRIRFQLAGAPGQRLADVRTVRSHPMALAQCARVIAEHGWTAEVAADTAGAARELAEAPAAGVAVLAPNFAVELYGLEILRPDVEDDPHNTTRFVVLAPEGRPTQTAGQVIDDAPYLTSLMFKTRDVPAALYKALGSFASNGVNLWKLESYLEGRGQFRAASFYIEIAGRPADPNVATALEELAFFTSEYSILGAYPADPARRMTAPAPTLHLSPHPTPPPPAPALDDCVWTEPLSRLRHSIDNIDAAVVHLLAERFKATRQIGALKAAHDLPPADPAREARQLARLRRLAVAASLPPAFAEGFLGFVVAEVIREHEKARN